MAGNIIKEFLVSLGVKVDKEGFKGISSALKGINVTTLALGATFKAVGNTITNVFKGIAAGIKMIKNAISGILGFIGGMVKTVMTPLTKAFEGIKTGFKHIVHLAKEDLAFQTLARKMMLPLKVARRMTIALDTLGASIQDIHLNPELFQNYKKLMEDSKYFESNVDFKEQMKSMRALMFEFARLKQYFRYGAYAIADGFLRAFGLPLKKVTEWFQNLNKNLIGNFNKISSTIHFWTKPIADFFGIMFKEGVKAFEGLGKETKGFIDSLIKMFTTAENPIAFVLAMLDDFNAWHEGEESYLAPFWEGLTNKIKEVYNDIKDKIESAIIFINKLWQKVQDFFTKSDGGFVKLLNSLDKIAQSLSKIAGLASGIGKIFNMWGIFDAKPIDRVQEIQERLFLRQNARILKNAGIDYNDFQNYQYLRNRVESNTANEREQRTYKKAYLNNENIKQYEQLYERYNALKTEAENQKQSIEENISFENKLKSYEQTIKENIEKANKKHGTNVTYDDIKAILKVENDQLNPEAYNSKSKDYGLMQINSIHGKSVEWLKNADNNLKFGINLYAQLLSQFKGDKNKAFTAYNTGAGGINSQEGRNYLSKIQNTGYYNTSSQNQSVTARSFTPFIQAQSNGSSCGQSSVAMTVNALTGKNLTDNDINNRYGFELLGALNGETKNYGFSWKDSGNFDSSRWGEIEEKLGQGLPVLMGLNGKKFSPSGRGHIVVLTSINGDKVTIADPNGGRQRVVSRKDIENAKGYPQGQFMFTASKAGYNSPFAGGVGAMETRLANNTIQQGFKGSAIIKNALTGQTGTYGAGTMLNNIVNINGGINVNVKNANASAEEIGNAVKVAFEEKTKFIQTGRRVAQVRAC